MTTTSGTNTGSVQLTITPRSGTAPSTSPWVIGESTYMYMRAKVITFTAAALKPNTRYYPFFNGVYVGSYCSIVNGQQFSVITSDTLGGITGNFYLPSNTFVAGSLEFKLVDNIRTSGTSTIADPLYGSAMALYEANGILKQQQTQITDNITPTPPVAVPTTPIVVTPPAITTCEEWQFQYSLTNTTEKTFTVITDTSTKPTNPQPSVGAAAVVAGTVTYVSTVPKQGTTQFIHSYRYRAPTAARKLFNVIWVGRTGAVKPETSLYRPSGVDENSVYAVTKEWTKLRNTACPVVLGLKAPVRVDPLAQSFFISSTDYPSGLFATSVSIYFKTVDQSTPVSLELREMINGLPGPNILPSGRVDLPGYATGQSDDASLATVFRFDQPIFLSPNVEYCFVIKSTSMGYNAWCSRMGEIDKLSGKVIDTQPYSGTLFKSENDSTWIPDSMEDVKFDLNSAEFNTKNSGELIFRPQKDLLAEVSAGSFVIGNTYTITLVGTTSFTAIGAASNTLGTTFKATGVGSGTGKAKLGTNNYYNTAQNLPLSYISTLKDSKIVTINIPMHGMSTTDKIYVTGIVVPSPATAYNNILAGNLNGEHIVTVIDDDNITITTTGNNATKSGNLIVQDLFAVIDNIPAAMAPKLTLIAAERTINANNLSPSSVQTAVSSSVQPTTPANVSDNSFTVYANIQANEVMIDYLGTEFDDTEIIERISMATAQSTDGTETPYAFSDFIEINRDGRFHSFDEPRMLASPRNETLHATELTNQPSTVVNLKLNSQNTNVSPIIDVNGMNIVIRSYKIDNQNGEITDLINTVGVTESDFNDPTKNSEIDSGTGTAAAKYKGVVNITTAFYNSIELFVVANCPAPAQFDAYIRTSTDSSTHMDRDWIWVPINGVFGTSFNNSIDKYVTNEWAFVHNSNDYFNVFDVKIVMRSTNNSVVPKIYGVRTITNRV